MNFNTLIKISRPRFWLYAAGTFLVGAIAGVQTLTDLLNPLLLVYLVYFIFFANVYIYGINDLFDDDTDQFNAKKDDKEHRLRILERRALTIWVVVSLVLGIVLALFSPNSTTMWLWFLFLALAGCYSAYPFRFKAKPVIDTASNVHYAVIGFLAYTFVTGQIPPLWVILAAWAWTASMHIYSAVPDIESDAKANLSTTAVVLGHKLSLVLCFVLWIICSVLVIQNFNVGIWVWLVLLYPIATIYTYVNLQKIKTIYWWFPMINAVLGLILFWVLAFPKI